MASVERGDGKSSRKRTRAKRACKECNARRVRCNVTEIHPCYNCTVSNISCELVASRRGKSVKHIKWPENSTRTYTNSAYRYQRSIVKHNSQENVRSDIVSESEKASNLSRPHVLVPDLPPGGSSHDSKVNSSRGSPNDSSAAPAAQDTATSATQDTDKTLYFGESNFLTYVTADPLGSAQTSSSPNAYQPRLCYPVSPAAGIRASLVSSEAASKSNKLDYLTREGAFTFPKPQECENVLRAYFQWFHPCFPILNRAEINNLYNAGKIPALLLQCILFIGASYCAESTLQQMGFEDRHVAKYHLYNRAKVLYDADWEPNKVTILQSLFLMSFWRVGPSSEKDIRHWLAAAINLAQRRGFHRLTKYSRMDAKQANIRKRIWWAIYVRERQSSAALGLPSRIRDEDCDIDMLNYSDLEEVIDPNLSEVFGQTRPEHVAYAVQMARLARLLGKIVQTQFTPTGAPSSDGERSRLAQELEDWKSNLPEGMKIGSVLNTNGMLFTYLLHLGYNHLYILLYRSAYLQDDQSPTSKIVIQAACGVTRIVEDMLSQNLIQFGQLHLITSVFSSLCIHTINIHRSDKFAKKLALHRAQVCLMGLKEMQKYWELNNLVLDLFFQYLDTPTARKLRNVDAEEPADKGNAAPTSLNSTTKVNYPPQQSSADQQNMSPAEEHQFSPDQPFPDPGIYDFNYFSSMLLQGAGDDYNSNLDWSMPNSEAFNAQGLDILSRCL